MDFGEVGNIGRPLIFTGMNYAYQKSQMWAFLWLQGNHDWFQVQHGWKYPMKKLVDDAKV